MRNAIDAAKTLAEAAVQHAGELAQDAAARGWKESLTPSWRPKAGLKLSCPASAVATTPQNAWSRNLERSTPS
ncbi:MAG: hypothetical protein ACRDJ9_06045 [Dehalococcoidia bacterium]